MTPEEFERTYQDGARSAWARMFTLALKELGAGGDRGAWILERTAAIAILRSVCEQYGDNDWEPSLHLGDIIEKHLWRVLEEGEREA